jgi:hypothetical protein
MLRAGRHPLLRVRQGDEGHIVVPYDIEDRGAAGYTIHVYNPNLPFLDSENGDAVQHENREFDSRVLVDRANDGSWQWSLSDPDWSGTLPDDSDLSRGGNFGPMTLSVLPYEAFPIQPTLPGSIAQGVVLLLDGNERADAVSAGGRPVPYLTPLDSHDAHGAWVLPDQGPYAATVEGTGPGTYGETFLGRSLTGRISDIPAAGVTRDHISADPRTQSITFATDARRKPFAVELVGHGNGLAETAALRATSFRGGHDTVALAGSGLTLHHVGPATTVRISLSAVGRRLAPSTFQSGALRIGANETATFRPRRLTALADGAVDVTLTRRGHVVARSTLHSRLRTIAAVSVGPLHAATAGGLVTVTLRLGLHRLPRGSMAVAAWLVRRNGRVIAHHTVTLGAGQLRSGVRTLRWTARLPRHSRLLISAGVAALAPAATTYQSVVRSVSREISVG